MGFVNTSIVHINYQNSEHAIFIRSALKLPTSHCGLYPTIMALMSALAAKPYTTRVLYPGRGSLSSIHPTSAYISAIYLCMWCIT